MCWHHAIKTYAQLMYTDMVWMGRIWRLHMSCDWDIFLTLCHMQGANGADLTSAQKQMCILPQVHIHITYVYVCMIPSHQISPNNPVTYGNMIKRNQSNLYSEFEAAIKYYAKYMYMNTSILYAHIHVIDTFLCIKQSVCISEKVLTPMCSCSDNHIQPCTCLLERRHMRTSPYTWSLYICMYLYMHTYTHVNTHTHRTLGYWIFLIVRTDGPFWE